MKKFLSVVIALIMVLSVLSGCGKKDEKALAEITDGTNVTVHKVALNDINSEVNYTGEVKAASESDVAPKVTATIKYINYDVGDYVTEGSVLAQLDDTDYLLAYNQALASYNNVVNSIKQGKTQAKASLTSAKMEYDSAVDNYNRQKVLYDAGGISKISLETAETRMKNAELNLNSANSNYETTLDNENSSLASAQVALESATNNINNTKIIAPISGYIASKNGNVGQIAAAGSPMFSIKNAADVDIEISVTESVIPYIYNGTKAVITVSTANINNIDGTVSTVNTVKNSQTGMYTVKIKIDNSENLLKIGMMADVTLKTQQSNDAIVIPSDAILQSDDEYYVYTVNDDNTAEKSVITIGITNNDFTEIKSGLSIDDIVVVSGKEYISDKNNKVKIVEE